MTKDLSTQNRKSYTYCIMFYDGTFYYGSRLCPVGVTPWDDEYNGSPITHKNKWNTTPFSKFVLKIYNNLKDARDAEANLIRPWLDRKECLNENVDGKLSLESCYRGGKTRGKDAVKSGQIYTLIKHRAREFTLKDPNGKILSGKNVSKFCRDNKLPRSSINDLLYGIRQDYKGWTLP